MNKKLRRTRHDNVLAGVCGGLANYFNIDVIVVRAIWVISALLGGPGLGTYIICALVIPKEKHDDFKRADEDDEQSYREYDDEPSYQPYDDEDKELKEERNKNYMGIALIGLGAYMTFKIIFPDVSFRFLWPAILIGFGLMLLNNRKSDDEEE